MMAGISPQPPVIWKIPTDLRIRNPRARYTWRIIDNPGNYLKYYTGYLEILTMRQEAEEVLGNKFNAKSFHQFILNMDGASFRVIKPYFQTWLMTEKLHV
ncbi:MAG: DUF885 family protein [Clostridium fessum]